MSTNKNKDLAGALLPMLVPDLFPESSAVQICGIKGVSTQSGTDLYDVFKVSEQRIDLVIYRIDSDDVAAALIASMIKIALFNSVIPNRSPGDIISCVNMQLFDTLCDTNISFTAVYISLHLTENSITFTNAGHENGLILKQNGTITELKPNAPAICQNKNATFIDETIAIESGDRIVLYSTSFNQIINNKKEPSGIERFKKSMTNHLEKGPVEFMTSLNNDINAVNGKPETVSSITFLIADFSQSGTTEDLIYSVKQKSRAVIQQLQQKIRLSVTLYGQALDAHHNGQYENSIEILNSFKELFKRRDEKYRILKLLGVNYIALKKHREALFFLKRAFDLYPERNDIKKLVKQVEKEIQT